MQSFWNWLDLILMLLAITAVISQVAQNSVGDNLLETIAADQSHFVSISRYTSWETCNSVLSSLLAFCLNIRILRVLSIIRMNALFIKSLYFLKNDLISFIPLFVIILFTFSTIFTLFFMGTLSEFNSLGTTLMNLFIYAALMSTIGYICTRIKIDSFTVLGREYAHFWFLPLTVRVTRNRTDLIYHYEDMCVVYFLWFLIDHSYTNKCTSILCSEHQDNGFG